MSRVMITWSAVAGTMSRDTPTPLLVMSILLLDQPTSLVVMPTLLLVAQIRSSELVTWCMVMTTPFFHLMLLILIPFLPPCLLCLLPSPSQLNALAHADVLADFSIYFYKLICYIKHY